ncbi:hypothetical protein WA026_016346 [Henosepilachna vigintioctopunctata]|uniref:Uncharacterized protein n=1 Tax=Henosepilachna vigintioctopunctata TaxID=420089 RepID=A0AAW1UK35_9CUCU
MKRYGTSSGTEIDKEIEDLTPQNTVKTHKYVWKQFTEFCERRNYKLCAQTSEEQLASILKDWAFNMKRADGTEYKEDARKARAAERKKLQAIPEKRKTNSVALKAEEISKIISNFDENTPDDLQKKFYQICSVQLAWRGNEAVFCLTDYFKAECDNYGQPTGRIEYNTIFSKTAQGGEKHTAESKWFTPNENCEDKCPVRLLKKMLSKRTPNIKTNRLFLTPNPD